VPTTKSESSKIGIMAEDANGYESSVKKDDQRMSARGACERCLRANGSGKILGIEAGKDYGIIW